MKRLSVYLLLLLVVTSSYTVAYGDTSNYEQFGLWTEQDPTSILTHTDFTSSWTADLRNPANTSLYRYSTTYFNDYTYYGTLNVATVANTVRINKAMILMWSQTSEDWQTQENKAQNAYGIMLRSNNTAVNYALDLFDTTGGATNNSATGPVLTAGTTYYLTITRANTTLTLGVYTDAARTITANAAYPLTITLQADYANCNYMHAPSSLGIGTGSASTGTISQLYDTAQQPYTYYKYGFSDTYYENGTLYVPSVNVTAIGTGFTDEFNTSGGVTEYYSTQPTLFTWDAGSGVNRRIYTRSGVSENFTITMPDGTFSVYEFTIRDYVGVIGNEAVYIESLRYINGTQTLIERAVVEDQINGVGLSLVLYKLYTIRLRYGSTTFDYDFVPGVDATPVLQLRDFTFTQRAQNINGYVTIEAQRNQTTGTNITGSYVDSRSNTILVEFIIQLLNGTQVYYVNSTSANVVFTWNAAVNTTDYKAIFRVNHTDFTGIRQAAFVLPGLRNYDALPSLDLIGDFGGINGTHIIGAILILIIAGIFSEKYIVAGGITLIVVAGVLNTVGLLELTSIQLTSAVIAAVLIGVAVWRRRG